MFRTLLLTSSGERCRYLTEVALETNKLSVLRAMESVPSGYDLARLLNFVDPEVALLDLDDFPAALSCADAIRARSPDLPIVGIGSWPLRENPGRFASFTLTIPYPPASDQLSDAVQDALHLINGEVETNLLAFLPAKAGSGASTLVLNTAIAAAAMRKKVLVLECDLRSGVLSIMLNAQPAHVLQEVLCSVAELDGFRLQSAVYSAHGVDWLLSDRSLAAGNPTWDDYFRILRQVKGRYDLVLVDLPELVNPATREIVRRARIVFNVCTPEVLSLRLAAQRFRELASWGVPEERSQILLNRWLKKEIGAEQVAEHLGRPVFHVFTNDYSAVRSAVLDGRPVAMDTALWKECEKFSAKLIGGQQQQAPQQEPLREKLLGLFR